MDGLNIFEGYGGFSLPITFTILDVAELEKECKLKEQSGNKRRRVLMVGTILQKSTSISDR